MAAKAKKKTVTLEDALAWMRKRGSKKNVDGLARFGISADKVFGVSVNDLRAYAKTIAKDHRLAEQLFGSGWYEARMLAVFVDEPKLVTPTQMDQWCKSFENWADCDTACFHLFDRTPHAWKKVKAWSTRKREFEKRAAFALIASIALHDKKAPDAPFIEALQLIEAAATDERNFVKKAVSWALRGVGHRNRALHAEAVTLATRLSNSEDRTARWIGKDALRDLNRPSVMARF